MASLHRSRPQERRPIIGLFISGSHVIGSLLVEQKGKSYPRAIASVVRAFPPQETFSFERLMTLAEQAVQNVLAELARESGGECEYVSCILDIPWALAHTRDISFSSEKSFVMDDHKLAKLMREDLESFDKAIQARLAPFSRFHRIIEQIPMGHTINGHFVEDPFGVPAKEYTGTVVYSAASKIILDRLYRACARSGPWPVTFCTVFGLLHEAYTSSSYFPSLIISGSEGETTLLTSWSKEMLVSHVVIPFGERSFVRRVAQELGVSYEQALSDIKGHYSSVVVSHEKVDRAIEHALELLKQSLHEGCSHLTESGLLRGDMSVFGESSFSHFLYKILGHDEFRHYTHAHKGFSRGTISDEPWMIPPAAYDLEHDASRILFSALWLHGNLYPVKLYD